MCLVGFRDFLKFEVVYFLSFKTFPCTVELKALHLSLGKFHFNNLPRWKVLPGRKLMHNSAEVYILIKGCCESTVTTPSLEIKRVTGVKDTCHSHCLGQ